MSYNNYCAHIVGRNSYSIILTFAIGFVELKTILQNCKHPTKIWLCQLEIS